MPTFKAPVYSKQLNSKGQSETSYTFAVEFFSNEENISFIAENSTDITLKSLQQCVLDNVEWWNTFIRTFLNASAKLFSKPYTVEQINKITKHTLNGTSSDEFPTNVLLLPVSIQIIGGNFIIHWKYICEPIMIDIMPIPDLTESEQTVPVLNKVIDGVEELNIDSVPMDKNATDETLNLDNPAKFYERQKVKEARLKAKLAMYKAQNQLTRYYEKYGDDISDSESESEYSNDEDEDEDEDGDEDIQL